MARRPSQIAVYAELLDRYGQEVADAFLAAVDDLRSAAEVQRLIAAIQARNLEAAMAALHLDPAAYAPLLDAIQRGYAEGGATATGYLPAVGGDGAKLVVRFNVRNPRSEAWLRDQSSTLVTRIIDDQRAAVRQRLEGGLTRGENPTTTALDIVGRVDRATGTRQGGVLGLSAPQEQYVANARQELTAADPEGLQNYLGRSMRDKRFDRTIIKAAEAGEPIPAETIRKALDGYQRRLLKLRGDTIGRTEALTSLRAAQHEAFRQAVESGQISEASVRRTWKSAHDLRVRHTHAILDGETVGLNEPFRSPTGARMMYPGDTSLGAGPEEIINCRCIAQYRIDFLSNIS